MDITKKSIVVLLTIYVSACTWVDLSPRGEKVRVLTANEVSACKRVGKTTVNTAAKVVGIGRNAPKVQTELNTLARNSAVDLGGDTVVAVDAPVEGRQLFEVYRCMP